jgi:hypothetical protein
MKFRSTKKAPDRINTSTPQITPPVEIDTALPGPNHPATKIALAPALENRAV